MSTLNSHRPLNPVVVGILEDNLLNSSADPRKALNEIISLDHLIRGHTTAGSFVCNRKRHVPHPQTRVLYYTQTHEFLHARAPTHVQTAQHDRFIVRYSYYCHRTYEVLYIIIIVGRPNRTFSHFSPVRFGPSSDRHSLYYVIIVVCVLVVNKMIVLNRRTRPCKHNAARCFN